MGLDADFIKKIQELELGVLKNKQNANNIVKLMKMLDVKREAVVFLVIKSLQRIFTHFINNGDLLKTYDPSVVESMFVKAGGKRKQIEDEEVSGPATKKTKVEKGSAEGVRNGKQNGDAKKSPEEVFSAWILSLYDKYITKLLSMLWREEGGIQSNSLDSLFHFAKLESIMQSKVLSIEEPVLQPHLITKILEKIITYPETNHFLLEAFCNSKLKRYNDVQYITYWILGHSTILTNKADKLYPYETTAHYILSTVRKTTKYYMRTDEEAEGKDEERDADDALGSDADEEEEEKEEKEEEVVGGKKQKMEAERLCFVDWFSMQHEYSAKKRYSEAWFKFLNLELSQEMLKLILRKMGELLPLLAEPFMMMDFLNKCYARGGIYSILALNGIFIEITKFNLDFPNFYRRLYSLFDTGVLVTKHRGEFFKLAIRFMFSKYLPAYTAAAFVKRIMRIALAAPPSGVILALAFAHNVLQLHPTTQVLVHRASLLAANKEQNTAPVLLIKSTMGVGATDPFDMENPNPAQCSAINSSLWELLPFMSHQSPAVAKMAQAFNVPLIQQPPYNMDDFADASYFSMFSAAHKDIPRSTPTNFIPRKSLFDGPVAGWVLPK